MNYALWTLTEKAKATMARFSYGLNKYNCVEHNYTLHCVVSQYNVIIPAYIIIA